MRGPGIGQYKFDMRAEIREEAKTILSLPWQDLTRSTGYRTGGGRGRRALHNLGLKWLASRFGI